MLLPKICNTTGEIHTVCNCDDCRRKVRRDFLASLPESSRKREKRVEKRAKKKLNKEKVASVRKKVKKKYVGRTLKEMGFDTYSDYLSSDIWKEKKQRLFASKRIQNMLKTTGQYYCECCGGTRRKKPLAVHHKTYANIFNEPLKDLLLVCDWCHLRIHEQEKELSRGSNKKNSMVYRATKKIVRKMKKKRDRNVFALRKRYKTVGFNR